MKIIHAGIINDMIVRKNLHSNPLRLYANHLNGRYHRILYHSNILRKHKYWESNNPLYDKRLMREPALKECAVDE